ncbi:unnamed protein product [Effrenium voratum]|nr:unnamed protein product [Effrenium voratum]
MLLFLADRVPQVTSDMTEQSVATVIWAVVKLSQVGIRTGEGLLPVVAARIPVVISKMQAQAVANVLWAAGQLARRPTSPYSFRALLPDLAARSRVVLRRAKPQEIANMCRGLALSEHRDPDFLQAVAAQIQQAGTWSKVDAERNLPQVLWSFARLQDLQELPDNEELLLAVAKKLSVLDSMNDWGLCALTWSYQQLDICDTCLGFHQDLAIAVALRKFSRKDVERSSLGPDVWR